MPCTRFWILGVAFALALGAAVSAPAQGQWTPADTAAVLLSAANALDREGHHDAAEDLLRYVLQRYPGTPASEEAQRLLGGIRRTQEMGEGRVGFVVYNTGFLTWLGVVIPAALGADTPAPFGAGILVGAPLGFFGSKAYATRVPMTSGQAALYQLSTAWLSWQALGWREVLGIGDDETCYPDGTGGQWCSENTPDTAPWAALAAGGIVGAGVGLVLTRTDVDNGTAAMIRHGAAWGTWYGLALGVLVDANDDALLTWTLLGGNAGIAASIPLAGALDPTPGQVRIASAAGLAGALVGLGIDLLLEVDSDEAAIGIPLATSTVGLIAGAAMTARGARSSDGPNDPGTALLTLGHGRSIDLPMPLPTAAPTVTADGRLRHRPAVQLRLFEARF